MLRMKVMQGSHTLSQGGSSACFTCPLHTSFIWMANCCMGNSFKRVSQKVILLYPHQWSDAVGRESERSAHDCVLFQWKRLIQVLNCAQLVCFSGDVVESDAPAEDRERTIGGACEGTEVTPWPPPVHQRSPRGALRLRLRLGVGERRHGAGHPWQDSGTPWIFMLLGGIRWQRAP